MKKINIVLLLLLGIITLTSCNSYLDELPDDRAELNSLEKVRKLLVSAYPHEMSDFIWEMSGDNVSDNGAQYTAQPNQDKMYRFEDVETEGTDDPYDLWSAYYGAVGTANEALGALQAIGGDDPEANALKAEALLCRAYGMFLLGNTFCMAYNPDKATTYQGVPYPKIAGESVDERGTLQDLYANIDADIEVALPLVSDAYLDQPKYHFNVKAAYAFAARFNLYYMNYDKAIAYATKALGSNPASVLRNTVAYEALGGVDAIANAYIQSSEKSNLMLVAARSLAGRAFRSSSFNRFSHGLPITTYETFWATAPWIGEGGDIHEANLLYGNNQSVYYPKMNEIFEYEDKINGTGWPHIADVVFTTDEALLVRAEAQVLKGNTKGALDDINTWASVRCYDVATGGKMADFTEAYLNEFFDSLPDVPVVITDDKQRGIKKPLHPQGFTVASGAQTNIIQCILQMRRIETWQQGLRFLDIKRYGIEYSHNIDGEDPVVFKAGDLRGAIQLPSEVITAGLEANPR